MKTVSLIKILQNYPLFTENDAAKIISKRPEYVRNLLYRLRKRKLIYKIERGKYTVFDDVFIFSSYISVPSYVSLCAIKHYNLTEQMPRTIFIMVPKSRKSLQFQNIPIEFVKTKYFFGYKKENYKDFEIFIAEPEKMIIDSLLSKKVPLDEIMKSVKIKTLNLNKLINYAIRIKNKSMIKRLGFILEERKFKCRRLARFVDNNYVLLDSTLKRKGKINKMWRIIDNRK